MATGASAGDGLFRAFEGCISSHDMGIQRRPYHRNCSCALHRMRGHCPHSSPKTNNISYPVRRSWSEGSLVVMISSVSANSSPCSSPANQTVDAVGRPQLKVFCDEDDHSY